MIVHDLGRRDYDSAHAFQKGLVEQVRAHPEQAHLVLVEHEPVYTIGRFGNEANVLAAGSTPVRRVERGGDVTYHGPGQLVGYIIYDLHVQRLSIKGHVCRIQKALERTLADYHVQGTHRDKFIGVWVGARKIASLGIAVSRRVTYHGFALNVDPDLSAFSRINPCGMPGCEMTSLARELGCAVEMDRVKQSVVEHLTSGVRVCQG